MRGRQRCPASHCYSRHPCRRLPVRLRVPNAHATLVIAAGHTPAVPLHTRRGAGVCAAQTALLQPGGHVDTHMCSMVNLLHSRATPAAATPLAPAATYMHAPDGPCVPLEVLHTAAASNIPQPAGAAQVETERVATAAGPQGCTVANRGAEHARAASPTIVPSTPTHPLVRPPHLMLQSVCMYEPLHVASTPPASCMPRIWRRQGDAHYHEGAHFKAQCGWLHMAHSPELPLQVSCGRHYT